MNKCFLFGNALVSVQFSDDLFRTLPSIWESFVVDDSPVVDCSIIVSVDSSLPIEIGKHGWKNDIVENGEVVTYSSLNCDSFSAFYPGGTQGIQLRLSFSSARLMQGALSHTLMLALSAKHLGLHCVTVLCGDQAICLAAPSGTGKTTLSKLLVKYGDAAVLNGDFALLSIEDDGRIMFEPTPFCGTSGICHNFRVPIDRIVFLEQGKENIYRKLNAVSALSHLLSNTFVPTWNAEKTEQIKNNAIKIIERIPIGLFSFTPTADAVGVFYNEI